MATVLDRFASLIAADPQRAREARNAFERAIAILEKLVAARQGGHDQLVELAATCGSLANLLCDQGLYGDAEAFYRKELACQTTLAEERPENVSVRFAHGRALHNLADFLRERGRTDDALPLERQVAVELASVYNSDFRNPEYRRALSYACWTLCALELDLCDHRAAATAIERYQEIEPTGFDEPLEAARFLCRCAKLSHTDRSLPELEREKLARSYANKAMDALETAVRNGYNDLGDLRASALFEPLRGRDDLARLIREVEARARVAEHD
jgi:tetratricopeptide (TPR) repeat protein